MTNKIDNKELILTAIDDYEEYTSSYREVLKILVSVAIDNTANVTVSYLMKVVKLTRVMIYLILKRLEKDGFITRIRAPGARHDSFKINKERIQKVIVQLYNNKKSFL